VNGGQNASIEFNGWECESDMAKRSVFGNLSFVATKSSDTFVGA